VWRGGKVLRKTPLRPTHVLKTGLEHRWQFLRTYIRRPQAIGSVVPSSRALAVAVAEPLRNANRPIRVLEVGAGTGPVTRYLGTLLTDKDRLDVCELQPEFADILERDVLNKPPFARMLAENRVRLLRLPVQKIEGHNLYDFIISGLPMTAFELDDVKKIFTVYKRLLRPNGVLSYFEYTWLRQTSRMLALGRSRTRLRAVNAFLNRNIREHEFAHRAVLNNFPPAHARHLRFTSNGAAKSKSSCSA
jgi:phospholipid N-methyltransferase